MKKTMKSYRLSNWAINNMEELKKQNPGLDETGIIEFSLALAEYVIQEFYDQTGKNWGEVFQLDNQTQVIRAIKENIKK